MKTISLGLIALALCVSCQKEGKPSEKISEKAADSVAAVTAAAYEAQLRNMAGPSQNIQAPAPMTANPTNTTSAPASATKPGMNPPHGQPGHRCDIAVGAPLNSKPAANTATMPNTQATRYTVSNPTEKTPTTGNNNIPTLLQPNAAPATPAKTQTTLQGWQGKPNPAHGQEGHRCDVKVGDPLP